MEVTDQISWFTIYIVVLISIIQLIMLVFVLVLAARVHKLINQIDGLSKSAGNFVRMGMQFFRAPKKPNV